MDNRLLLLLSAFAFATIECLDTVNNPTVAVTKNATIPETALVENKLPSLCTVCNCTGDIINCDNRALTNHFEDPQWPDVSISIMSFKDNKLVHLKPFPKVAIKTLILRRNEITKIDDCAFKQLINLTELDLSYNQLTSELLQPHVFEGRFSPEAYEPLAKLRILNLGNNVLHSLHQDLFEHMISLKVLILAGNPFQTIDARTSLAISSLVYLEELDLSYCGLQTLPDHQFHSLRYLKKLNLTSNRLPFVPISLEEAMALEYLYLDENPIQVINHLYAFPTMTNLKELSLCCMPDLTTVGKSAFSGLTALENVRIENCPKLEAIDEDAFVHETELAAVWPPLKKLDLSDNALRYLPALLVGRWDWLEELDLMNNKWSCDCDNQYLISSLLPMFGKKLMGDEIRNLTCASPPEHAGKNLTSLSHRKLRCLDFYGAQPEKDAAILVGVLIGLLLAIPICLALFILWRRGFLFCDSQGPASFSRAFYKRAANDEDL